MKLTIFIFNIPKKKYVSFIFRGGFRDGWDCFSLTITVSITGSVTVGIDFC